MKILKPEECLLTSLKNKTDLSAQIILYGEISMIYRLLLSFSAISWIIVVYIVKSRVTLFELPWIAVTAISIAILIIS